MLHSGTCTLASVRINAGYKYPLSSVGSGCSFIPNIFQLPIGKVLGIAGILFLGAIVVIAVLLIVFVAPKLMKKMNKSDEKKPDAPISQIAKPAEKEMEKKVDAPEQKESPPHPAEHPKHHVTKHKAHKKN